MMEEFQKIPLGDLVKILDAKRKPITKSDRKPGKYPYYGASGIADYIDDFIFDGTFLLLSEDGDNLRTRNTPIAFIVKGQFWVNNHAHILEANSKNLTEYLCYALQVADIDSFISGSTRPKLTQGDIRKILISTPPLPEQKAIAHILGTLDDKIELNRQMNQTLEAMAQAMFKSWFVDFDPVMDNALASNQEIPDELQAMAEKRQLAPDSKKLISTNPELAAKFPSSFVFNETLGKWIPEGWEVKSVEDAILVNPSVSIKKGEVRKYIDMKALPTSGYSIDGFIEKEYSGGAKFKQGDVLLARITPCLENGKTAIVDFLANDEAAFGSTEFIILRGKNQIKTPFIACLARFEAFVNHCIQNMVGSSGRQRVQNSCFNSYYLALPENELLKKFDLLTNPYFKKITDNSSETKTLTQLRDRLLPELIIGRVRVKELDEWPEHKLAMVAEKRAIYNSKS